MTEVPRRPLRFLTIEQVAQDLNVGEPLIVFEVPDNTAGIVGTVPAEAPARRRVRLTAALDED